MLARVMQAQAQPGKLEDLVGFWDEARVRELREARGNAGFYLLANPSTNKIVALSLWEGAEAADASQALFKAQAVAFGRYLAGPLSPAGYEVRIAAGQSVSTSA